MALNLDLECTEEDFGEISRKVAGYDQYKNLLGLTQAEIEHIDQHPASFYSIQGRFYKILLKWKSKLNAQQPPQYATFSKLVKIARRIKDGWAVREFERICAERSGVKPTDPKETVDGQGAVNELDVTNSGPGIGVVTPLEQTPALTPSSPKSVTHHEKMFIVFRGVMILIAIVMIVWTPSYAEQSEKPSRQSKYCLKAWDTADNNSQVTPNGAQLGAVHSDTLWGNLNRELTVHFMNPELLEDRDRPWKYSGEAITAPSILSWAKVWNVNAKHYPKISLNRVSDPQRADIRIKFSNEERSWSHIGSNAQYVSVNEPTMVLNLHGMTDKHQLSTVLHEFGHALGLKHEHERCTDFWDILEERTATGEYKLIGMEQIEVCEDQNNCHNPFKDHSLSPTDSKTRLSKKYDPQSIMHYWFDVKWLKPEYQRRDTLEYRKLNISQQEVIDGILRRDELGTYLPDNPSVEDYRFLNEVYECYSKSTMVCPKHESPNPLPSEEQTKSPPLDEQTKSPLSEKQIKSPPSGKQMKIPNPPPSEEQRKIPNPSPSEEQRRSPDSLLSAEAGMKTDTSTKPQATPQQPKPKRIIIAAGDRPKKSQLLSFKTNSGKTIDFIKKIGIDYKKFGELLLDDSDVVNIKVQDCNEKIRCIVDDLFTEWLKGRGRLPVTWETLADVLEDTQDFRELANIVREHFSTLSNHSKEEL